PVLASVVIARRGAVAALAGDGQLGRDGKTDGLALVAEAGSAPGLQGRDIEFCVQVGRREAADELADAMKRRQALVVLAARFDAEAANLMHLLILQPVGATQRMRVLGDVQRAIDASRRCL